MTMVHIPISVHHIRKITFARRSWNSHHSLAHAMDLPVEVIQHIFYFLSPREIVRLRQVSKQFRGITCNDALWREIYANTRSLLPPGPFSYQSAQYLERTLVQSEFVSKTWTSQPLDVLAYTYSCWKQRDSAEDFSWAVVFGRWCIFLEGKIVQYHDIDTDTYHSLYDGTSHSQFFFTSFTTTNTEGHWVYLLLIGCDYPCDFLRLLEFRVTDNDFSKPEILDWTHIRQQFQLQQNWMLSTDHYQYHGSTPFLVLQHHDPRLVFDLRTRNLYTLPTFHSELINQSSVQTSNPLANQPRTQIIPTSTHIIAVRTYDLLWDVPVFIQAFVTSNPSTVRDGNGIGKLCLTHQAAVSIVPKSLTLLRNSAVDPTTESVNIRLLHTTSGIAQMTYLDLTLPEPDTATDVLPMHIRTQLLFESCWSFELYTAFDDGHVRGLLLTGDRTLDATSARKFSIDASGEECIATFCDPFPINCPVNCLAFDGFRGRIHWYQSNVARTRHQIITADLV